MLADFLDGPAARSVQRQTYFRIPISVTADTEEFLFDFSIRRDRLLRLKATVDQRLAAVISKSFGRRYTDGAPSVVSLRPSGIHILKSVASSRRK